MSEQLTMVPDPASKCAGIWVFDLTEVKVDQRETGTLTASKRCIFPPAAAGSW